MSLTPGKIDGVLNDGIASKRTDRREAAAGCFRAPDARVGVN